MMKCIREEKKAAGFTLIELLVSIVLSTIVIAAVYGAYTSQQDSYIAQDQVAEMQQNLRAGLELMMSDIRMAGYDSHKTADATITAATGTAFTRGILPPNPLQQPAGSNSRSMSIGKGLAISPNLHVGRGDGSKAVLQTSTGAIKIEQQNTPGGTKSGKSSWIER